MKPEMLVVVSDLHCGSTMALMPPQSKTSRGNVIGFGDNVHQAWLWECWTDAIQQIKTLTKGANVTLCVNGDAVEGVHHRPSDPEVVMSTIDEHTNLAVEALKPLRAIVNKVFVTKGTECHTQGMEDKLADKLRAESGLAKLKWKFKIHGCLIDATHHMPTTSRKHLEAGALSIIMRNAQVNYIDADHDVPHMYLRAHRHCGGWYDDGKSGIGVTGAWQFLTRYGYRVVPDSIPIPSVLLFDWSKLPVGSLPSVRRFRYDPPEEAIAKV